MKILVRSAVVAAMITAGTVVSLVRVPQPALAQGETELGRFMRKKLEASSHVLEGLATNDPGLIRKGAASMLQMSKAELWNALADADYRELNGEFRSALRKLDEAAANENLDNALLQWFDTVKGCVECHKYVRDERARLKK